MSKRYEVCPAVPEEVYAIQQAYISVKKQLDAANTELFNLRSVHRLCDDTIQLLNHALNHKIQKLDAADEQVQLLQSQLNTKSIQYSNAITDCAIARELYTHAIAQLDAANKRTKEVDDCLSNVMYERDRWETCITELAIQVNAGEWSNENDLCTTVPEEVYAIQQAYISVKNQLATANKRIVKFEKAERIAPLLSVLNEQRYKVEAALDAVSAGVAKLETVMAKQYNMWDKLKSLVSRTFGRKIRLIK